MPQITSECAAVRDTRTDAELVDAIRVGDQSAFSVLYERYFQRVLSFSQARLRNRADAEEAVQDTFTVVFKSIDAYRGQASLLSWVYGIARNTVNNQIRRNRAHEQRLERAQMETIGSGRRNDSFTPEERLSFRRCAGAVEEALTSVTSWQAEVFMMRHFENLPIQEIADRTCRSNDAVRSSLYRMKRLVVEAVDNETLSAN
ncbi:MAG: RNA polymerase sigma factor [Deltaproteobacteria bacterium]|nr:RNA polymerase sigma factor [Deltaproteobacteria bacterium]